MKNLINEFTPYLDSEEFVKRMDAYARIIKTPEWKFVSDIFLTIKGEMMVDMFSQKYTVLPEKDKDVLQKTYYQINLILEFLSDPKQWAKKKTLTKQMYDQASKAALAKLKGSKENGR